VNISRRKCSFENLEQGKSLFSPLIYTGHIMGSGEGFVLSSSLKTVMWFCSFEIGLGGHRNKIWLVDKSLFLFMKYLLWSECM